ncbi:hypothetical protein K2173_017852 [Erythroxylum novogranatense]|uniref:DUF4005 domain-containing protein n=1 Tax=Erythroxylum novogranatense TaxID=1862640 RepID=A0AAV8T3N8_9ROSI|nr:hypothetical protein K2173_017852 [Erythroxylum novogranatense]
MGKATRWMINFLLGKENKHKKKNVPICEDVVLTQGASAPSTPKRRWSFGKSSSKGKEKARSSSFDAFTISTVQPSSRLPENRLSNSRTVSSSNRVLKRSSRIITTISKAVEEAAATRIQAVYRSHLAIKALNALKALVKLQALVRGYLVRKQAAATMRGMHALMAIQVKARCQRVQMAEKSKLVIRENHTKHPEDNGLTGLQPESSGLNLYETSRRLTNGYMNHSQIARIQRNSYSGELSISKRKHQYKELYFSSEQNSSGRASFSYQKEAYAPLVPRRHPFAPNYMSNTESSRAKVRSTSEPKQRPNSTKPKAKQSAAVDGMKVQQDSHTQCYSCSHSPNIARDDQEPWFIKLYTSTRLRGGEHDTMMETSGSHSNNGKLLDTYEVSTNSPT